MENNLIVRFWRWLTHARFWRSKFWRWQTLENWRNVGDLGAKLAAILGAIALANFFVLQPELTNEVTTCTKVDGAKVASFYGSEAAVPLQVRRILTDINSCTRGYTEARFGVGFGPYPNVFYLSQDSVVTPSLVKSEAGELTEDTKQIIFSVLGYDDTSIPDDIQLSIPLYVYLLVEDGELSLDEVDTALEIVDTSRYRSAEVIVRNVGQVIARGVNVVGSREWELVNLDDEGFDLLVGGSRIVEFSAELKEPLTIAALIQQGVLNLNLEETTFDVLMEPSEVLNKRILIGLGVFFLVILVTIIVKEISAMPPAARTLREVRWHARFE